MRQRGGSRMYIKQQWFLMGNNESSVCHSENRAKPRKAEYTGLTTLPLGVEASQGTWNSGLGN